MSDFHDSERYVFIVETKEYPGSWHRELCSYATGVMSDCGAGGEELVDFLEECPLFVNEHGESIFLDWLDILEWNGHKVFNSNICKSGDNKKHWWSYWVFLNECPSEQEIELILKRSKKFLEKNNETFVKMKVVKEMTTYEKKMEKK